MNRPNEMRATFRPVDLAREADFELGPLLVRPSLRRVVRSGREEAVQPRVMQVLIALVRARGAVVSREELVETCWDGIVVGDDSITHSIAKVRLLAECGSKPAFEIETIPRVGYRLVPSPAAARSDGAATVDALQAETAIVATRAGGRGLASMRLLQPRTIVAALMIAAIAALATAALRIGMFATPLKISYQQTAQQAPLAAVLPFTPLYGGKDAQTFADEISSAIADTLGRTDLNVVSPALSFQFRSDSKARAARALHANVLVDGGVRRQGDTLRVSVRVEDVASGLIILSKDIERQAAQASDLPDQVATFVAGALGGDDSIRALTSDTRWNPRVRTGFIRAVFECPFRQDPLCAYEVGRSLVKEAPGNAMAQTILAIETTNALFLLPEGEKPAAIATARKAAWTAIRLDPHWGEPFIALGVLATDTASAEAYLRRGLSISPDSQGLAGYLSGLLISNGRGREALGVIQKVASRFTYAQFIPATQISAMLQLGQTEDALEIAKRARNLWPERGLFVLREYEALAFAGDAAGTDALLKDPTAGPPNPTFQVVAQAMHTRKAGDIEAVSRICTNIDASEWPRLRVCLLALTMLGKMDQVFQRPIDDSAQDILFWPQTARLRADPRFLGLTEQLHLLPYWKATHSRPDFCATEHVPVCQALAR
ncbi:MAG TPA: winged helix-turn-helix domain-containing protein [Rhizomicrobium sp.]